MSAELRPHEASADESTDAGSDAAEPDPAESITTAVGATTVSADSLVGDLVRFGDGAITTDGSADGIVEVEVTGPAVAMVLARTDAAGELMFSQQWDTWVGPDSIPAPFNARFSAGSLTYQLGVFENGVLLNDAAGRVSIPAGAHSLRIAGANVGSFVSGSYFRVALQRPDQQIVWGPVLAY